MRLTSVLLPGKSESALRRNGRVRATASRSSEKIMFSWLDLQLHGLGVEHLHRQVGHHAVAVDTDGVPGPAVFPRDARRGDGERAGFE